MKTASRSPKSGFTLIELLAVVAVIGILAAILITGISSVRERAQLAKSNGNLRQLWSMVLMYTNENGGRLPSNGFNTRAWQHQIVRWNEGWTSEETTRIFREVDDSGERSSPGILDLFRSPLSDDARNTLSWGSPGWTNTEVFGRPLATIQDPSKSVALAPFFGQKNLRGSNWQQPSGPLSVSYQANGEAYCAFVDGHIGPVTKKDFDDGRVLWVYPANSL